MNHEIEPSENIQATIKRRRIWVSIILTIIFPALPLIYNGRLGLGLVIGIGLNVLIDMLLLNLFYNTTPLNLMWPLLLIVISLIFFMAYNIIDTKKANSQNRPKVKFAWLWILGLFLLSEYDLIFERPPQIDYPDVYTMTTTSMEKTILYKDVMLAYPEKSLANIKNGDLVVYRPPQNQELKRLSRCIAKAGQTIEIRDKKVFIDSIFAPLPDQAMNHDTIIYPYDHFTANGRRDNMPPLTIPAGCFFVLGDNRDYSIDSRYQGAISESLIVEKPKVIVYSVNKSLTDIRWNRIGIKLNKED